MEVAALCSIECFETSAITSVNVERAFYTIIQQAYNHKLKNANGDLDGMMLKQKKAATEKKGCC